MEDQQISFLESIAVHSVDIPEWLIKKMSGKPESLSKIFEKHEGRYLVMLRKVKQFNGNMSYRLRDQILGRAKFCTKLRYSVACARVRVEKHFSRSLDTY